MASKRNTGREELRRCCLQNTCNLVACPRGEWLAFSTSCRGHTDSCTFSRRAWRVSLLVAYGVAFHWR